MRCSEQREGDREIESGTFLLELGRRQIDDDASSRKVELRGENSAPYSLLRFLAGTVGEPDDRQRRSTALDMRLHLHPPRLEADEGKGDRAREHASTLRQDL